MKLGAPVRHDARPAWAAHAPAADERRVLHARLRPAATDGAWALRWALEDALRCASFDDCGRLVVVRRLRLTAGPGGGDRVRLTAAIERAWRAAARAAVPALSPGDPGEADEAVAEAVWFASPGEALQAALVRRLEGAPLAAWFWPRAVALLATPADAATQTARLFDALTDGTPAAARALVLGWPEARRAPRLARLAAAGVGVDPALGREPAPATPAIARAAPASDAAPRPDPGERRAPPAGHGDASASSRPPGRLVAAQASGGPGATRTPDSGPMATGWPVARPSGPSADPDRPAGPARPDDAAAPAAHDAARATLAAAAAATPSPAVAAAMALPASPAAEGRGPALPGGEPPGAPGATVPPARPPQRPAGRARWPWLEGADFTPHGGVLWVLNLLPAAGFPASAPPGLVRAVLAGLMDRAGLAPDDPQRAVLPPPDRIDAAAAAADPPPELRREARRWQARARRLLRRRAGLSIAALAAHPAWVSVTFTHADLVLALDAVELRLRRLGLDRDPGWVPWLGRIVSFHFVDRADLPAPPSRHG